MVVRNTRNPFIFRYRSGSPCSAGIMHMRGMTVMEPIALGRMVGWGEEGIIVASLTCFAIWFFAGRKPVDTPMTCVSSAVRRFIPFTDGNSDFRF